MARVAGIKKGVLNTTINEEILKDFKDYCKEINCPLNVVLETFMAQFADGQFCLKLGKNKIKVDLEE